jgi:Cdc6-like AAA superfamily ATPase
MLPRKEITEVFTPRRSEVNVNMYVHRPKLEVALSRAFKRNSHTLVFGESGNGKSWLYKKVLEDNEITYVTVNCANASRAKSLTVEICNCLVAPGTAVKLGYNVEKAAEVSAFFAKGGLKQSDRYDLTQEEPLLQAFKLFASASERKKIIVLDNLESIFNSEELMDELSDIIILLDDSRYAECNINFLVVGVPNGVLHYFRETKNAESVANRIQEMQKVSGLDSGQVREIVSKGFAQLQVPLSGASLIEISDHVSDVTLGIPQRVHEFCEHLAYAIKDNKWTYLPKTLPTANKEWLTSGLRHAYSVVEKNLNSRETTVARRNQVIYCIGRVKKHEFDSNDIDKLVRENFPRTVPNTNMGIGSILADLATGTSPLISKNAHTGGYSVKDPRFIMCIKLMLYMDLSEKVQRRKFTM